MATSDLTNTDGRSIFALSKITRVWVAAIFRGIVGASYFREIAAVLESTPPVRRRYAAQPGHDRRDYGSPRADPRALGRS